MFKNIHRHRCCCCISMKNGINLIGIYVLIDFGKIIWDLIRRGKIESLGTVYIIIQGVSNFFMVPAFIMFIRYWCNDNISSRVMLTRACLYIIITQILGLILFLVFFFYQSDLRTFKGDAPTVIVDNFVTLIIRFLLYIYFMGITSQWVIHLRYQVQKECN